MSNFDSSQFLVLIILRWLINDYRTIEQEHEIEVVENIQLLDETQQNTKWLTQNSTIEYDATVRY